MIAQLNNLVVALDNDDVAKVETAVQPLLDALGTDVHGPIGDLVKAIGRNARRERIRRTVVLEREEILRSSPDRREVRITLGEGVRKPAAGSTKSEWVGPGSFRRVTFSDGSREDRAETAKLVPVA